MVNQNLAESFASNGSTLQRTVPRLFTKSRLLMHHSRLDRLRSLCDEINGRNGQSQDQPRAVALELDVSASAASIEASVQKAWATFGRIDALINNAGIRGGVHNSLDLSEKELNDNIKTNLTGTWLVSKYVCMRMRDERQGGSVVNISSIAGLERGQLPGGLAYVCAKTAINAMTKVMALELGAFQIRVNSISPGLFKSEITQDLMQKDWLKNVERRVVPLRTFGTSNPALTSLLRLLIHDSSKHISGNLFIVDAGVTLPGVPIFSSL
ncbi:UNVERIFIED_CONTAM: putative NAD-dependent oxidoreductase [Sesamum radiatum]|uniref:NAD-dependent oxidoreductase n=1 Tax=Sesamum radiatum TaxID=300843 RepID=A0AAW2LCS3_SESRA